MKKTLKIILAFMLVVMFFNVSISKAAGFTDDLEIAQYLSEHPGAEPLTNTDKYKKASDEEKALMLKQIYSFIDRYRKGDFDNNPQIKGYMASVTNNNGGVTFLTKVQNNLNEKYKKEGFSGSIKDTDSLKKNANQKKEASEALSEEEVEKQANDLIDQINKYRKEGKIGLAQSAAANADPRVLERAKSKAQGDEELLDILQKGGDRSYDDDAAAEATEEMQKDDDFHQAAIYQKPGQTESKTTLKSLDSIIDSGDTLVNGDGSTMLENGEMEGTIRTLHGILLTIGVLVAALVGAILGIKFMTASVEGKAEIKALLVPYVVGCAVVFGSFAIWKVAIEIFSSL